MAWARIHAPDVFHVQQEISRATGGSLCAKVRKAEGEVEKAKQKAHKQEKAKEKYDSKKQGRGRPPNFDKRIEAAREQEQQARVNLAVVDKMVATIAFYWLTVNARIESLELAPDVEQAVFENLLPAYYLFTVNVFLEVRQRKLAAPSRPYDTTTYSGGSSSRSSMPARSLTIASGKQSSSSRVAFR